MVSFSDPPAEFATFVAVTVCVPVISLSKFILLAENVDAPFASAPDVERYWTTILLPASGALPSIVPSLNVNS